MQVDDDFEALLGLFIKTLRKLGEAGRPEDASRLAARGWSTLRHSRPVAAERINGTMHYLARLPEANDHPKEPECPQQTSSSTSAPSRPHAATS